MRQYMLSLPSLSQFIHFRKDRNKLSKIIKHLTLGKKLGEHALMKIKGGKGQGAIIVDD